jgi:hypothetical protein
MTISPLTPSDLYVRVVFAKPAATADTAADE